MTHTLVLVQRLGNGSCRYSRVVNRSVTDIADSAEPLDAESVEDFRLDPLRILDPATTEAQQLDDINSN